MTDALAWLRTRTPPPPERLMRRMERALDGTHADGDLVIRLGDAAIDCLRAALAAASRRDAALDLLAADGLLTYAWEAASTHGADGLDRFAAAYSPDRLATLLSDG